MIQNYYIITLLILFGFNPVIHLRLIVRLNKISCTPNLRRVANLSCSVKAINRYERLGNMYGVLLKPTYFNNIRIKLFRKTNGWQPFVLNFVDDACRVFKYGKLLPFTDVVYNISMKYSNINHTCPFEGEIFAKNVSLNETKIYDVFPPGEYRLDIVNSEGKVFLAKIEAYGVVINLNADKINSNKNLKKPFF